MNSRLIALPMEAPEYHARKAARLRTLASEATTFHVKARLSEKAEQHERLAAAEDESSLS